MYFRFQQSGRLLKIDDNFAHLNAILPNGDLEFEFIYAVSQREAVSRKATRVSVTVEGKQIVKKPLLGTTQRGFVDNQALVDNIRTAVIDAKTATIARGRYRLAQRDSDITAHINNDIIAQLSAKVPTSNIQSLNRPRLTVVQAGSTKESNDPQPILHRVANSSAVPNLLHALTSSAGESAQALMLDMINRQGLDPSHITNLTSRTSSDVDTRGGMNNQAGAIESSTDPASRLLNHYLFPPVYSLSPRSSENVVDAEFVTVLRNTSSDMVIVPVTVVIPAGKLTVDGGDITQAFVTFDLVESNSGLAIDTVTRVLDLTKHLRVYYTPKFPPRMKASRSDVSSRINLEIKQVDPGATEVLVYKKPVWISTPEAADYTLIGTYDLKSSDQSLLVQVEQPRSSPVIYRTIARSKQSMLGFEYSSVAAKPTRYTPPRAVSLIAIQVDTGIKLELRRIPSKVVAVQFRRQNMTIHEAEFTIVGDDSGFISDDVRRIDMISTIDSEVASDRTYSYTARLIYANGVHEDFGKAVVEFIQPAPGTVDTKVENLTVDHDAFVPNVTFTILTKTIDTDLDAIKRMLEQQGLITYFSDDVLTQRDQLQKLIAHSVKRVDLNTGRVDDFGVVTTQDFDDSALRKNQAIDELEYGHRYRYEIYPLLRSPETMFDSFRKTSVDPVTKKQYTWSPAKFLHPLTLKKGILVTAGGAKKRYGKDPMVYGIIGSQTVVEVSFDSDVAKIIEPEAAIFDRYTNLISWKTLGNVRMIDHFLIFKEVHGIRTLLGKTHSEFEYGSCQYLHNVDRRDAGALKYVIVPIMNDYKEGPAAFTNTLIIEQR